MAASDETIYNGMLSFLKGQQYYTQSMYTVIDGMVDDFIDNSGLKSMGPFSFNGMSDLISGIATAIPSSSCLTLLLHFDGTNGDTTVTDSGPLNINLDGDLTITSSVKKFGSSSGYFDGSSKIQFEYDLAANVAANENFTVEYRINMSGLQGGYRALVTHHSTDDPHSLGYAMYVNPQDNLTFEANYGSISLIGSATVSDDNWHHIALVRSGSDVNNLKVYVDGNIDMQTTYLGAFDISDVSYKIGIGRFDSDYYTGYMDELRIVRNWAVYSSSFTPPVSASLNSQYRNVSPPSGSMVSKYVPVTANPAATYVLMAGRVLSGSLSNLLVEVTRNSGSNYYTLACADMSLVNTLQNLLGLNTEDNPQPLNIYAGKYIYTPVVNPNGTNTGYRITAQTGSLMFNLFGIVMYSE